MMAWRRHLCARCDKWSHCLSLSLSRYCQRQWILLNVIWRVVICMLRSISVICSLFIIHGWNDFTAICWIVIIVNVIDVICSQTQLIKSIFRQFSISRDIICARPTIAIISRGVCFMIIIINVTNSQTGYLCYHHHHLEPEFSQVLSAWRVILTIRGYISMNMHT